MDPKSLESPLCTKPGKPIWSLQTAIAETSLSSEYMRKALREHSVSAVTTVILSYKYDGGSHITLIAGYLQIKTLTFLRILVFLFVGTKNLS